MVEIINLTDVYQQMLIYLFKIGSNAVDNQIQQSYLLALLFSRQSTTFVSCGSFIVLHDKVFVFQEKWTKLF